MAKINEKKPKKPKVYNVKTKITNKIRSVWRYSPLRKEAKKRCEIDEYFYLELPRKVKGKVKVVRVKFPYYRCQKCRKITETIDIDHIDPVVDPKVGFQGFDVYILRLFCDIDNLMGLCETCHNLKSGREQKVRKAKKSLDKLSK